MKRMISALLVLVFALSFAASVSAESLVGGWKTPDSRELTPEALDAFNKAMEGLVGVDYKPVALLGTQLVAGMNYCILCEAKVVYPGAEPYYAKVTVYEDLKGNATVTDIEKLDAEYGDEQAATAEALAGDATESAAAPETQQGSVWRKAVDRARQFMGK